MWDQKTPQTYQRLKKHTVWIFLVNLSPYIMHPLLQWKPMLYRLWYRLFLVVTLYQYFWLPEHVWYIFNFIWSCIILQENSCRDNKIGRSRGVHFSWESWEQGGWPQPIPHEDCGQDWANSGCIRHCKFSCHYSLA